MSQTLYSSETLKMMRDKKKTSETKQDDAPPPHFDSNKQDYDFRVFACGTKGGGYAAELTSFLVAEKNQHLKFLSMDGGTSYDCLKAAKANNQLDIILHPQWRANQANTPVHFKINAVGYFRQQQVNGFLVTHAHNDHLTGLVISSADEKFGGKKPIFATAEVMNGVRQALDRPAWPNMIELGFYTPQTVNPSNGALRPLSDMDEKQQEPSPWANTHMHIRTYPLSHDSSLGRSPSTAFKVCNMANADEQSCFLFFGDTGPDWAEYINAVKGALKEAIKTNKLKNKNVIDYLRQYYPAAAKKVELKVPSTAEELEKLLDGIPKYLQSKSDTDKGWTNELTEFRKIFQELTKTTQPDLGKNWGPLRKIWDSTYMDIKVGKIHTIFIECSYMNSRPSHLWFGHLVPAEIIKELNYLASKIRDKNVPLSVVVMHIKPSFAWDHDDMKAYNVIKTELRDGWGNSNEKGNLGVEFFFPLQTDMLYLKKRHHAVIRPAGPNMAHSGNARMEMENLLRSDFGHNGDKDVDYGNVNGYGHGQFMHHRQTQYGPKWHESYHDEASQPYVGGDGGGYYLAPAHPPIHYQNPFNVNLLLVTTLLMFLCVCVCCASFVCGFSVRHVMRKLIKKTKRYQVNEDEVEHKYVV